MGLLGDWIAQILVDTSKIGPSLSSAKSEWSDYYSYIQKRDEETTKYVKKSLVDIGKADTTSRQEALDSYKNLTTEEKKLVDTRVKSYNTASIAIDQNKRKLEDLRLQVLKYASIAISVPITFLFDKGLKEYLEFTQQMQNIKAVVGATSVELQMLANTAVSMSEKFSSSPIGIAKAMFDLGQAGLDANEIYKQIGPVMTLAAAGMKDVSFTAEMVVTTLKSFQLSSESASTVADIFASSNAKSVSSLDKLSASLKYTAGLWSSMGWSLEELVGTLDTLYDTGVRGEKAGRLLASAINGLQRPSRSASTAIENLLGYTSALDPAFNNIGQIIGKLAAAHATTQDVVKIFGKESAEVINRLVQNYGVLDDNVKEVTGNMGESARQAAIQMDNLNGKMNIMKNTFSNVTKSFASTLDPALKGVVVSITSVMQVFEKAPTPIKALLVSLLGVAAVMLPLSAGILSVKSALIALSAQLAVAGTTIAATLAPVLVVAAAVSGLSAIYIMVKKNQQDWIDTVDSGVASLSKQGKSIDAMVDDLGRLGDSIEDQKKSKAILEELAAVFPRLREQLNKNAGDTASAMRILRQEYANLKQIEADRDKSTLGSGTSYLERQLAEQKLSVDQLSSKYADLTSQVSMFKMVQGSIKGTEFSGLKSMQQFSDYVSDSQGNLGKIMALLPEGDPILRDWVMQLAYTNGQLNSAKLSLKGMQNFAKSLGSDSANAKLKISTKLVEQIASLTEDMTNKVWSLKYDLQLANKQATATDVANAIGEVFDGAIRNLTLDNKIDMKSLGLMSDDGSFTQYYKDLIAQMGKDTTEGMAKNGANWATVMMNTFDANVKDNTSFDTLKEMLDGLSKYQAMKIDIGIETDPNKISDLNKNLAEMDKTFGGVAATSEKGLTANQIAIRKIVQAYLAWGVSMSDNFGKQTKGAKETLDWWEQIIQKTVDAERQLKGYTDASDSSKNITSLNEKVRTLATLSGTARTEVQAMADRLKSAFEQNPELKSISDIVTMGNVAELTKNQLDGIAIALAKAFGFPVNVQEYKNQLAVFTSTRKTTVSLQSATENGSVAWMIYQKQIESVDKAMLELAGNAGAISDFSFKAGQFTQSANERIKGLNEVSDAYKNLSTGTVESIRYIVDNIDPESGLAEFDSAIKPKNILSAIKAADELAASEEALKQKTKENTKARNDGTMSEEEYAKAAAEVDKTTDELNIKKTLNMQFTVSSIQVFLSDINSVIDSVGNLVDVLKDADSTTGDKLSAIGDSIMSLGSVIAIFNVSAGGIVAIIGLIAKGLAGLSDIINSSTDAVTEETSQFANAIADAKRSAEESMQDSLTNVGQSLGQYIADGFSEGLSLSQDDMAEKFAEYMYNMISTALITASGFEDKVASIAEKLWAALSPGSAEAATLQKQIETLFDTMGTSDTAGLQTLVTAADQAEKNMAAALKKMQETQPNMGSFGITNASEVNAAVDAYTKAIEAFEEAKKALSLKTGKTINDEDIASIQSMIDQVNTLQAKIATLNTGITNENGLTDSGALDELNTATAEYSALLAQLSKALGITTTAEEATKTAFSSMSDTITSALADAALTGSYSDFKQAVYKAIVSNITSAVISAGGITSKIQSLVSGIINAGTGFSSADAQSLLAEIRSVWTDVTDENTPLGSVMMSLRDALSQFGLLDVSVNPGTVVSAIPSDVRDDLITAIKGTMDTLSQAIAEAGLNSTINTVNITTAYITAMSATEITIAQANMSVSGGLVMQVQTGSTLESWLESWMDAYIKKSGI